MVVIGGVTVAAIVGIFERDHRRAALEQGRTPEQVLGPLVRFRLIPAWPRYLFIAQLICLYMATGLYKSPDKLIARAAEARSSVTALAEEMSDDYLDNLEMLGVDSIDVFPRATEHIPEMISMIEQLMERDSWIIL